MFRDFRLAVRQLGRRPGLTTAAVLTLAVGITAATASFSLVNAAFLRSPGVSDPSRLISLYTTTANGVGAGAFSYPDYRDLVASSAPVSGVMGYSGLLATWNHDGRAESLFGELVTGTYFQVLGITPVRGRLLTPDDDRVPGQHPVIVISHGFWRQRLGADPEAVGRPLTLNGRTYTVVGVAPPEFRGMLFRGFAVDVWAPSMMMGQLRTDQLTNRGERWMFVRARLAQDTGIADATAAIDALAARLSVAHPETNEGRRFRTVRSDDVWVSPDADGPLTLASALLIGACLVVLLVGASNVMSLLAARMLGRSRELAVQTALGASRFDLFRQLLAESLLIATLGGAAGLLLTTMFARAISAFRPPLAVPLAFDVVVDLRVAAFALTLTGFAGLMLALVQLRRLRRADTMTGLRDIFSAGTATPRMRRHWLLVPQVAGSLVLLVLAGLFARSVGNASAVDRGFEVEGVGMLTFNAGAAGLDDGEARAFFERLGQEARMLSGVEAVAITSRIPLDLYGSQTLAVSVDNSAPVAVQAARVSPGYFETFQISTLAGETFTIGDLAPESRRVVVSRAFATRFWPAQSALGRALAVDGETRTVVGIVADARVQSLGETSTPLVYVPMADGHTGLTRLVVRSAGIDRALDTLIERAGGIRPDVALFERRTMAEHVEAVLLPYELGSTVSATLGFVAALLAGVGVHGLVAFAVASRRRELGIRLALGASSRAIVHAASADAVRALAIGLAAGILLSTLVAQALTGVVFGIAPVDPPAFAGAAVLMLLVATAAAAPPVRRALRTDPARALRLP